MGLGAVGGLGVLWVTRYLPVKIGFLSPFGVVSRVGLGWEKNLGQGGLGDGAKGGAPLWSVNSGFGLLECVMCPSSAAAFARPGSSAHQSLVRQPRVW